MSNDNGNTPAHTAGVRRRGQCVAEQSELRGFHRGRAALDGRGRAGDRRRHFSDVRRRPGRVRRQRGCGGCPSRRDCRRHVKLTHRGVRRDVRVGFVLRRRARVGVEGGRGSSLLQLSSILERNRCNASSTTERGVLEERESTNVSFDPGACSLPGRQRCRTRARPSSSSAPLPSPTAPSPSRSPAR